ncbi:MAG: thrombospondin type 3 repeat-containing protein [Bradymonadaceae bacterium]
MALALVGGCGNAGGSSGGGDCADCNVRGRDVDSDGDGIDDADDNCAKTPNPKQSNLDGDDKGNACDTDRDGDGTPDSGDNCPDKPNADQRDADGDGKGDPCDLDRDGDGVENGGDCAPLDPKIYPKADETCDSIDSDCDGGIVDEFDDADGDKQPDCVDSDRDGDGLANNKDNCPDISNAQQKDVDKDGKGDPCDPGLELGVKGTKLTGEAGGDFAGQSVAGAGDFNGDGRADFLVGADNHQSGGTGAGAAYLFFGESNFKSELSLGRADAKFVGTEEGEKLGAEVAGAGDVDGDGKDDVLIGAWLHDGGGSESGAVYLIHGASSVPRPAKLPSAKIATQFKGEESNDSAGFGLAGGGDFNGDGLDDMLIGANGQSATGTSAGAAYLVYGSKDFDDEVSLEKADVKFKGSFTRDQAGHEVAFAGDLDGDGLQDVLVGAPGRDTAKLDAGAVYLIRGEVGLSGEISLTKADAAFTGTTKRAGVGRSITGLGDVNGDALDDIAIGAPTSGGSTMKPSGRVYVVFGDPSLKGEMSLSKADVVLKGEPGMNDQYGDRAGSAVAGPGDVTGDGTPDLLIGASGYSASAQQTGAAYVVEGSSNFGGKVSLKNAHVKLFGPNAGDIVGEAVAAGGDIDGKNGADLLISARGDDTGGNKAGAVYLHFGPVP